MILAVTKELSDLLLLPQQLGICMHFFQRHLPRCTMLQEIRNVVLNVLGGIYFRFWVRYMGSYPYLLRPLFETVDGAEAPADVVEAEARKFLRTRPCCLDPGFCRPLLAYLLRLPAAMRARFLAAVARAWPCCISGGMSSAHT